MNSGLSAGTRVFETPGFQARLRRRRRQERLALFLYRLAIGVSLGFLLLLFVGIASRGLSALNRYVITLSVSLPPITTSLSDEQTFIREYALDPSLAAAIRTSAETELGWLEQKQTRAHRRALNSVISTQNVYRLAARVWQTPELAGQMTVVDLDVAGDGEALLKTGVLSPAYDLSAVEEPSRSLAIGILRTFDQNDRIQRRFNHIFFTGVDSRYPEVAGIFGAVITTIMTLMVMIFLVVPVGVLAAIYLQELAAKNWFTLIIEALVNNLAAVPSIVFGLMGLAILLNFFGLPRSTPLVGGIVLALMTLPVVIITTRSALKAVPNSIREAGLAMGASRLQMVFHQVLPVSVVGILTGVIVGVARAVGETAPLLMIGMMAFVASVPTSIVSPGAPLPVQIYLWSDSPERAFVDRTSLAILALILITVGLNLLALWLRHHYEKKLV